MSTLSLHNLQGIATYQNKIEVPSGHKLTTQAGQFRLPNYAANNKPGLFFHSHEYHPYQCYCL